MEYCETVVQFGNLPIKIVRADVHELVKEVTYIDNLNKGAEGRDCRPFFEKRGGYEFFGLRDANGAEVTFGKSTNPDDPDRPYFPWKPGAKHDKGGYKGFTAPQLGPASGDGQNGRAPEVSGNGRQRPGAEDPVQRPSDKLEAMRSYLENAEATSLDDLDHAVQQARHKAQGYGGTLKNRALKIVDEFAKKIEPVNAGHPDDDLPF